MNTAILPARYRNPRLIARGGMGEIYAATDSTLGRVVAVKVLDDRFALDDTFRARFTREALAAARLSSDPSTVTIFDVGEYDGRPFIVMEYVTGGSLEDVIKRDGAQTPARALEWLEQAAHALDHAHEQGVVHRDVKPANLLLGEDGGVRVADFGVASARGLVSLTQTGTVIGTAGYLSPEQALGKAATAASDCYALGVVAFELFDGRRPFENSSATAEAAAHVQSPVPSIARLPHEVNTILARAMAKDPSARFATCSEFVAALQTAFADDAGATGIVARVAPQPRRRFALPLLLALLLAGGILAAVLLTTRDGTPTARQPLRVTVTERGTTVERTITERTTTQRATPPPTTAALGNAAAAAQGFAKLQAGDYAGALPLLEEAAQGLQASGSLNEAYNDYNLAFALAKTQGCSSRVLNLLDASQQIQGHRKPIDDLRHSCRKASD